MRILHVINNLSGGGAEKLLVDMSLSLKVRGHEVFVLVLGKRFGIYEDVLDSKGICVQVLNRAKYDIRVVRLITSVINENEIDVVHSHLFPTQYFVALAKSWVSSDVRFITTEHSTFNTRRKFAATRCLDSCVYEKYDHIICISDGTKKSMSSSFGTNVLSRCFVVYNGVNLDAISSVPQTESRDRDIFRLIVVGRFAQLKNQATLIKALPYIKNNVEVLFVGDGAQRSEVEGLAKELGVYEKTKFLGFRKDVYAIMKSCDLQVITSSWEGFGLVAVEGMACGLPIVSTNVDGLNEVIDGVGVFYDMNDPKDLAVHIDEVLGDEQKRLDMIAKGKERAKQYDINLMVDKYLELYNK